MFYYFIIIPAMRFVNHFLILSHARLRSSPAFAPTRRRDWATRSERLTRSARRWRMQKPPSCTRASSRLKLSMPLKPLPTTTRGTAAAEYLQKPSVRSRRRGGATATPFLCEFYFFVVEAKKRKQHQLRLWGVAAACAPAAGAINSAAAAAAAVAASAAAATAAAARKKKKRREKGTE